MKKVVLGHVFLRVLLFSRVTIIKHHVGINNRPLGARSSEIQSQPIGMNNNNL
jgi:hypothetical protein